MPAELISCYLIDTSVNYATIGSNNDLSPLRRQAIISTNAGILIIGTLEIKFRKTLN